MKPRKKRETFDPTFSGYIREILLDRDKVGDFDAWPFSLPVVKTLSSLSLHPKVTFLVGENGSGKSTMIEAIAQALGMNVEGGSKNFSFSTRVHESPLGDYLKIVRGAER
jgi:predicted ATPase